MEHEISHVARSFYKERTTIFATASYTRGLATYALKVEVKHRIGIGERSIGARKLYS